VGEDRGKLGRVTLLKKSDPHLRRLTQTGVSEKEKGWWIYFKRRERLTSKEETGHFSTNHLHHST